MKIEPREDGKVEITFTEKTIHPQEFYNQLVEFTATKEGAKYGQLIKTTGSVDLGNGTRTQPQYIYSNKLIFSNGEDYKIEGVGNFKNTTVVYREE